MVDAKLVWDKIFGQRIRSFTVDDKEYTVNRTNKGWECTCKDFEMRHGSYIIQVVLPAGRTEEFDGCKHIEKVLTDKQKEHNSPIINVSKRKKSNG